MLDGTATRRPKPASNAAKVQLVRVELAHPVEPRPGPGRLGIAQDLQKLQVAVRPSTVFGWARPLATQNRDRCGESVQRRDALDDYVMLPVVAEVIGRETYCLAGVLGCRVESSEDPERRSHDRLPAGPRTRDHQL